MSLSNHILGKGLVEAGNPVFLTGEAAWEGSAKGEGTALAKPCAVPPSPSYP